jgi:hypothetical protein
MQRSAAVACTRRSESRTASRDYISTNDLRCSPQVQDMIHNTNRNARYQNFRVLLNNCPGTRMTYVNELSWVDDLGMTSSPLTSDFKVDAPLTCSER